MTRKAFIDSEVLIREARTGDDVGIEIVVRDRGPGIADDCRGLAVVLRVIESLDGANIETEGPITFVGTVGEEGLGDLRGVKALFGRVMGA